MFIFPLYFAAALGVFAFTLTHYYNWIPHNVRSSHFHVSYSCFQAVQHICYLSLTTELFLTLLLLLWYDLRLRTHRAVWQTHSPRYRRLLCCHFDCRSHRRKSWVQKNVANILEMTENLFLKHIFLFMLLLLHWSWSFSRDRNEDDYLKFPDLLQVASEKKRNCWTLICHDHVVSMWSFVVLDQVSVVLFSVPFLIYPHQVLN